MRLRDLFRGTMEDLAFALLGSRSANIQVDRLRATLASMFGFEDVPPDAYIEQAARYRIQRITTLERRWSDAEHRARERLHQLLEALQMLRDDDAEGACHYLWSVTIGADVAGIEAGGLQHPGSLPGEEVGDG